LDAFPTALWKGEQAQIASALSHKNASRASVEKATAMLNHLQIDWATEKVRLRNALESASLDARASLVETIGKMGKAAASEIPTLVAFHRDPLRSVEFDIVDLPKSFPRMVESIRENTVIALERIITTDPEASMEGLARALQTEEDQETRKLVVQLLLRAGAGSPRATPLLIACLQDANVWVRRMAVDGLATRVAMAAGEERREIVRALDQVRRTERDRWVRDGVP
jgi:HEAT repeat protein